MGDDKYTFVEGVKNPGSCTILIKGPNEHVIYFYHYNFYFK
jgi:T-complex protein 1 subunit zeta